MRRTTLASLALALCMLTGTSANGCGGGKNEGQPTDGEPRAFSMGISSLPRELNADAYAEAFELAGDAGDIVLIQRTPPWEEFLPGGAVSAETADTTAAEIDAADGEHLDVFFAIDPTDGATGRDRLAALPSAYEGSGFDDPNIRAAFAAYAEYVVLNYRPAYLAVGVEMNRYIKQDAARLDAFLSLYQETYARVKDLAPETQVTITFQYEDLQSLLPTEDRHFADWSLFERFEPHVDVAAISTYPGFAFPRVADIPENYYSQLRGFTDKRIVVAETGFSSAAGTGTPAGTPEEQAAFVERMISEAEDLQMPAVIWFAGWDPAYADGTAYQVFRHIGLRESDGTEKPSWESWRAAALRPFEPG